MRRSALAVPALMLALLGSSLSFAPSGEAAQLGIHESVDPPFVDGPFLFKNQDLGQSFLATSAYRLVRVEVMVHDLDLSQPLDPVNLTIETDAGGIPSGTAIANASADGDFGYRWLAFDLVPPADLAAGQTYWLTLANGMNQQSGYKWATKSYDSYPGGVYATRSGGGSWTRITTDDLLFRNWGLSGPNVAAAIDVDSSTAGVGDPLSYTVSFDNTGTETASFVWANLTLSPNQTYESDSAASAGGVPTGPTSWVFADVGIGPHSFRVNASVRSGIFDGLLMESKVTVDYANMTEGMQERSEAIATVTARVPSITATKVATPRFLGPDQNLTYTVTIVNSGSRPSARLWVNDTLPPEVVYLGNTASALANYSSDWWDGTTLRVNLSTLPQGTYAFDVLARTRAGLTNGTLFANLVYVDYTDVRGIRVTPNATAIAVARIHGASIQVAKSAGVDAAGPGQDVVYRIRYDNRGNAIARWVWINDTLPPEVSYVSDTGGGVLSGSIVRFAFANVSVGSHSLTITARVGNGTPDGTLVRNAVTLSHTDSDGSPAPPSSATANVLVVHPIVTLAISLPPTADPGDLLECRFALANEGNGTAAGVWVNLTLPPELRIESDDAATSNGTATPDGWAFPTIPPGDLQFSAWVSVGVGLADGTPLHVNATATYVDDQGRVAEADPALHDLAITAPVLDLTASVSRTTVPVGETVRLEIAFPNTGGGNASDVWVNVTLPERAVIVSATESWSSTTGLRFTWHLRGAAPGARVLTVTLRAEPNGSPGAAPIEITLQYTDANGNPVATLSASTTFSTVSASHTLQSWTFILLLAVVAALTTFIGYRVYGVGSRSKGEILQLFLLHKSGLLIKHYTRHLHGALDTDILAAMIVAVQNFVRESFRFKAGSLEEMTFGEHRILLAHGEYGILAAVVSGRYLDRLKNVLRQGIVRLEADYGAVLANWGGVVDEFDGIDGCLDQILKGRIPGRNGNGPLPAAPR